MPLEDQRLSNVGDTTRRNVKDDVKTT